MAKDPKMEVVAALKVKESLMDKVAKGVKEARASLTVGIKAESLTMVKAVKVAKVVAKTRKDQEVKRIVRSLREPSSLPKRSLLKFPKVSKSKEKINKKVKVKARVRVKEEQATKIRMVAK